MKSDATIAILPQMELMRFTFVQIAGSVKSVVVAVAWMTMSEVSGMDSAMKVKAIAPWFGGKRTLGSDIAVQLGKHTQYFEPCPRLSVAVRFDPGFSGVMEPPQVELHWFLDLVRRVFRIKSPYRVGIQTVEPPVMYYHVHNVVLERSMFTMRGFRIAVPEHLSVDDIPSIEQNMIKQLMMSQGCVYAMEAYHFSGHAPDSLGER